MKSLDFIDRDLLVKEYLEDKDVNRMKNSFPEEYFIRICGRVHAYAIDSNN